MVLITLTILSNYAIVTWNQVLKLICGFKNSVYRTLEEMNVSQPRKLRLFIYVNENVLCYFNFVIEFQFHFFH